MMRALTVTVLLLTAAIASAAESLQSQAERIVRTTKLGSATFAALVTDLSTGEDLVAIRPDEPLIPASNQKLITTAAALSRLGADHVLSTELRLAGDTLIVIGSGDPAFLDPVILEEIGHTVDGVIDRWVEAIARTGRKQFDAILVDDRIFDTEFVHPSWPRNQLQHWYCAQVAGINFNDNCLDFYAAPTSPGKPLRITLVPEGVPVTLQNQATTGSSRHLGSNRIVVTGQSSRGITRPEFVTIHDPPMAFGGLLRNRLGKAGIAVQDVRRPLPDEALPEGGGRLLAAVETTLPTVLIRTNRDSQNLFAEALVKYLGHRATGRPGNWPPWCWTMAQASLATIASHRGCWCRSCSTCTATARWARFTAIHWRSPASAEPCENG
jgi:serine-type D-Ala-D-Ala carboxypeptidase/endopeptidase (penicillin-binding protein 4)